MRILHVLDISVPMLAGYTARSVNIVNSQRNIGLEPVVLTSVRHDNPNGCSMQEIDGVRYYRTLKRPAGLLGRYLSGRNYTREFMEIESFRRRIVEVARREKVDLIHGHSSILCGIPAYMAARQLNVPIVYEVRAFWEDAAVDQGKTLIGSQRYMATQAAETWLVNQVDGVVTICEGLRRELLHRGTREDMVDIVKNGVNTDQFKPMPRDPELEAKLGLAGKTVVSYIGTFASHEGVCVLIDALHSLFEQGRDDLVGLIIGTGFTEAYCRQRTHELGLQGRIIHLKPVDHAEIARYYSLVDIMAYPRLRRRITELATPLKPLEPMAMGKAVIGSNVGGILELIDDQKTGLVAYAENPVNLAEKIAELADHPELRQRLGQAAREEVLAHRKWNDMVRGYIDVYDKAKERWSRNGALWKSISLASTPINWLS